MKETIARPVIRSLRAIRSAVEPLESRALLTAIYVDVNAPGTQTGANWDNAYTDLQGALAVAGSGDEVRVADGTYKPTATSTRTFSFVLGNGVKVKGGFQGYTAPSSAVPGARDVALYPTILSGDIGTVNDASDNSYHVVSIPNNSSGTLDGLTITAGNASVSGADGHGGGVYGEGFATITDCTFVSNNALLSGGAVYYDDTSRSVFGINITGSTFSNNTSASGGAIWANNTDMGFSECAFTGNASSGAGGAIYATNKSIVLAEACVFTSNSAGASGGAIYGTGSIIEADNSYFYENSAAVNGGAVFHTSNFLGYADRMVGCVFVGNSADSVGGKGGALYMNSEGWVINSTFTGNSSPSGAAIYSNGQGGIITNSILWEDVGTEIVDPYSSLTIDHCDNQDGAVDTLAGNRNDDPLFVQAPDLSLSNPHYGNLELRYNSPLVDQGDDASLTLHTSLTPNTTPHGVGLTNDLVGQSRKFGTVDMGAYEQVINSWQGTGTGSWSNTANWDLGRIPNKYDVALIGSGVTVQVSGADYDVGQLVSSSDIQISTGTLKMYGDASITGVLTLSSGGSLDIQEYTLAIHFSTDPVSTIKGYIASAFNAGSWTGTGLTSSRVAANSGHHWRVGYFDGNTDTVGGAAANELLIKPLLAADANGDGAVDFSDYIIIAQNYNGSADWQHADFDYDGVCDFDDLTTYGQESGYNTHTRPLW